MSKLSVDEFLALLERSRLVESDRLAPLVAQWKSRATPHELHDADACAEHFVRSGLLTRWQSQKLLEGRHRGFLLGNYKLLDHLGSGGMSNVYLAEHLLMQRRVAIKVLPRNRVADSSLLARFHFEGQAAAVLNHQNIVRAYDLAIDGRIHYLVMEYVEGSNLEELVGRTGPLGFHLAAIYIAQAAAGLEHAHAAGLVHRDVKPANLLVDCHETVKILDMGLAKFEAEVRPVPEFAQDREVLGTAEYLAPEQAVNSLTVDHRADIYGLGCTLYFLLSGQAPFQADTTEELIAAHQQKLAPGLLALRPGTPRGLAAICRKMMEKLPANRYQSAREVADALRDWLENECAAGRVASPGAEREIAASLRDTVAELRETAQIGPPAASSRTAPADVSRPPRESTQARPRAGVSDALAPPVPPPVVPPPLSAPLAPLPAPVTAVAARPIVAHSPSVAARAVKPSWNPATRTIKSGGAPSWLWTALVSLLVLGAVLLAVFAFAE